MLAKIDTGLTYEGIHITLESFLNTWLNGKKLSRRERTVFQYRKIAENYILPNLGKMRIQDIRPVHIQRLYSAIKEGGTGARTLHLVHSVLHNVLGQAVREGALSHNPADAVERLRWEHMVNAANHAVEHHPHWKAELGRLEPHLGRSKAIVAIARKLLVAVWHVLNKQVVDRFADPQNVARSFLAHAYKIGVRNLPKGQSALAFTREQLDRSGLGKDLQEISWGSKLRKLPPSKLLIEKE